MWMICQYRMKVQVQSRQNHLPAQQWGFIHEVDSQHHPRTQNDYHSPSLNHFSHPAYHIAPLLLSLSIPPEEDLTRPPLPSLNHPHKLQQRCHTTQTSGPHSTLGSPASTSPTSSTPLTPRLSQPHIPLLTPRPILPPIPLLILRPTLPLNPHRIPPPTLPRVATTMAGMAHAVAAAAAAAMEEMEETTSASPPSNKTSLKATKASAGGTTSNSFLTMTPT